MEEERSRGQSPHPHDDRQGVPPDLVVQHERDAKRNLQDPQHRPAEGSPVAGALLQGKGAEDPEAAHQRCDGPDDSHGIRRGELEPHARQRYHRQHNPGDAGD